MENSSADQNECQDMTQSITSIADKESIEDKYNKLRGFAIKLKKKVSDLTEQIQNLESEKLKITSEKDDLQIKFVQITESAKKVQTIQLEYDKMQDKMEQCKMENKKLLKNVESLINQNTSLKESLFHEKDSVSSMSAKIEHLMIEKKNRESSNKQFVEEIKKLKNELKAQVVIREQKDKEYDNMKVNLEAEINAHKNTKAQLDSLKQEHTSNSVLSLEVENYEKSIKELKAKCDEESLKREAAEQSIEKHLEQIASLNSQISELQDNNLELRQEISNLQQKYDCEKINSQKFKDEVNDLWSKIDELTKEQKNMDEQKKELREQLTILINEKNKIMKESSCEKENKDKVIKDLTLEVTELKDLLEQSKQETGSLRQEFDGYKLRAQSVLRTKDSSKTAVSKGKSIMELEEELEHAQFQNDILKEKFDDCRQKVDSLTKELAILKEEKDHVFESRKELNEKLTNLRQEYRSLMEQNKLQESKIQRMFTEHKTEIEQLHEQYKLEINDLKEQHQGELLSLKSDHDKAVLIGSSKNESPHSGMDRLGELNFESAVFSRIAAPLIEREECEGSESIDSNSQMALSDEKYRRHSLMPLDELLNLSDDYENVEKKTLSSRVSRQELEVCERRAKHLTVLLADAERDIAKLTQQNEILKEDIRRQQRSAEREEHANNFEYLKNVVFKFVTLKNGDERNHLIPVLTTILKLSPNEINKLNAVAGVSGKRWIPGIPGWHH